MATCNLRRTQPRHWGIEVSHTTEREMLPRFSHTTKAKSRLRDWAVHAYLWSQRRKWPLPRAARSLGRKLFAPQIDQMMLDRTDPWRLPLNLDIERAVLSPSPGMDLGGSRPVTAETTDVWLYEPLHSEARPRIRCLIATGALKLGGQEMVALFLARHLPHHGFDTSIAHTPWDRSDEERAGALRLDGVPVVKLAEDTVAEWLSAHRPDVISLHGAADWLVTAAAAARIPMIETLHGAPSFFDQRTLPTEQLRSRDITGFVAVSELVRQQYLRFNPGCSPDRVITIPNGVDSRHIGRRDRAQARAWLGLRDEFLFVSLARYHLQKNTFGLVAAFSDVVRACPEARLICAGDVVDRPYFEQVRQLRDRMPSASQISLCGPCPDVSALLAAADAFVLDSFFEGWSMASMEALFTGLPAVLSEVSGAREQVGENGCRGIMVSNPLGDPEAIDWQGISDARFRPQLNRSELVEAMCTIIVERDAWHARREELRGEAMDLFSIDQCVQRHADVLMRAVVNANVAFNGPRVVNPLLRPAVTVPH